SGKSVLLLGRPGVGKTTMLREAARVLADLKRVVIVDTSNEIGGDGDIPHPAIGKARRMQVPTPSLQHEVMIEAVENHNPEVIVIDEIGREAEAAAARTIAERGVQLIGTAHGRTLDNLLLNPTLSDLVGGIEAVTLSDEEARRRGTQKTVLERRAPPTFDVLIEIVTRDRFAVHQDIMVSVDALLRGFPLPPQIRTRDEAGQIQIEKAAPVATSRLDAKETKTPTRRGRQPAAVSDEPLPVSMRLEQSAATHIEPSPRGGLQTIKVYPHGVARNRLMQAAKRLGVPAVVVKDVSDANALVTLKTYYRDRQQTIVDAEHRGMPIYVLRANTVSQMEQFLSDLFNLSSQEHVSSDLSDVKSQTQQAISAVLNGERWVDLPPGPALVRRLQHEMARNAELVSHSYGKEPRRHVRIFRE
ncbi:MAG: R3H domain-containing nucleic acid-binding protein, partial [Chloroflexota bacterium]